MTMGDKALFTSDYFDTLYDYAVKLVKNGKAYIDDQSAEEISAGKTNPTILESKAHLEIALSRRILICSKE